MSNVPVDLPTIWAGSTLAFSGFFYYLYRKKKEEIETLKAIPKFQPSQELLKIVKASGYNRMQYVVIEGVVQPEGVPLTSQYASRCTGVIQKVVVCKHRRVWDSVTRLWKTRTVNQEETTRSVPFCLVAPGSSAGGILVKVREPQKAEGLDMERVYKHQQPITNGLADFALLGLTRLRSVTWEVKEEMLRVGTVMTAMGEVVLEGGRVLRLQPPEDGHRYCLYPQSYESFLQTHHKVANMWKWLAGANGITGASLLTWAIYRGLGNTKRGG